MLAYAAFVFIGVSLGAGGVLLLAQMNDYGVDRTTIGTQSAGSVTQDRAVRANAYARLSSSTGMVRTPSVWRAYSAKPG